MPAGRPKGFKTDAFTERKRAAANARWKKEKELNIPSQRKLRAQKILDLLDQRNLYLNERSYSWSREDVKILCDAILKYDCFEKAARALKGVRNVTASTCETYFAKLWRLQKPGIY